MNIYSEHRSAQSKMLLALSLGTSIGLFPFTVFRFLQHDWGVAFLDLAVVVGMASIFIYVYITNDVKKAGLVLILVALFGNVISFYIKGIGQISWIYPAMLSAYYIMSPKRGLMVNFFMFTLYLPKLITLTDTVNFATIIVTIVITNVIAYIFAQGLRTQALALEQLASEDYLTSTGNRRALQAKLEELHGVLKNHDRTATLLLLDLDHFKKVNDTYGHIKGDSILKQLSGLLYDYFNQKEHIFRFGGEEFLVVSPDKDLLQTYQEAQGFRRMVKDKIAIEGNELTISIGVAEYVKEESIDEWIHRVDLALYQAKNEGRDRVIRA